jgi:protein-disulfide isomerase
MTDRARLARLVAALLVLCAPAVARAEEPVRGSADAPVTILVFSAFGCPYCAEAETQLETLRTRYRERLQIVFKHYPLGSDADALLPHEAALAAAEQDRFWAMHDRLFAQTGGLSRSAILRAAREIGLDEPRFSAALGAGRFRAAIERDLAEARALKVRAAPTFFVDGIKLEGLQTLETMDQIVSFRLKDQDPSTPAASAPGPATPAASPR